MEQQYQGGARCHSVTLGATFLLAGRSLPPAVSEERYLCCSLASMLPGAAEWGIDGLLMCDYYKLSGRRLPQLKMGLRRGVLLLLSVLILVSRLHVLLWS